MNKENFVEKIREYRDLLYLTAWSVLGNEQDAEDAVEDAVLSAYEHLDQLRNPESFKFWILKITKNEALKLKKKQMNLPGDETVEALLGQYDETYDEFSDILGKLPEKYRLVTVLYYYDELSLREIAKLLRIPIGTVKSRLSRAKDILKNMLKGGM